MENKKGRILALGDVHGANKALLQVLERCNFDNEVDTLISLGDIADGWNEVPECVDTLLGIKNLIAIRGNHDVWLRDWLKSGYDNPMWRTQGGQASYDAYIRTGKLTDQAHKDFFENQIDYYIDEDNKLYVHAGWDYTWKEDFLEGGLYPVNGGNPKDNIAKECHWSRDLFYGFAKHKEDALPLALRRAASKYNKIFVGHTSLNHPYEVFHKANFYNIDTGAGWSGRLSIIDTETDEIWQSDLISELYPGVRGRK